MDDEPLNPPSHLAMPLVPASPNVRLELGQKNTSAVTSRM